MANRQQLKTRSSQQTEKTTTTRSNSKSKGVEKMPTPEFGVKNQRWLSDVGGVTFVCKNPYPISYRNEEGKIVTDTVVYGEGNATIYKSESDDLLRDPIMFRNRVLNVPKENPLLQEYLYVITKHGGYTGVKLEDKEAEAELELEIFELEDANAEIIQKSSFAYKKAVYSAMGGFLEPSANEKSLTARLRKLNRENPQKIHDYLHKESVETEFMCEQVIAKGYVVQEGDKVIWKGKDGDLSSLITNTVSGAFNSTVLTNLISSDKQFKEKWLKLFVEALES